MTASTAAMLNQWLEDNSDRIAGRFQIERIGDWALREQAVVLDIYGNLVVGSVTVWPEMISDFDAMDARTSKQLFCWSYMPFSTALLDEWLSGLEFHSGLGDFPPPALRRSGIA